MAKYTTLLKTLLDNNFKIDLQSYPIFLETHRAELNQKIIDHFYFREIGFETAELFNFHLRRTMNEIMPYYNRLFETELLEFDPLLDFSETETLDKDSSEIFAAYSAGINKNFGKSVDGGSNKETLNDNSTSFNVYSDTPQQNLVLDPGSLQYASNTTYDEEETKQAKPRKFHSATESETADNTQSSSATDRERAEDYTKKRSGKSAGKSYSELVEEYRKILLNIDMMIISELETLFMLIY